MVLLAWCAIASGAAANDGLPGLPAEVIERLRRLIEHEVQDKQLPAFSIALVDGRRVVWSAGFGWTDTAKKEPAAADTVYRVGSISKLFTDVAIMQLVERGELDLESPVSRFVPEFQPQNPFGGAITLGQLLSHRAGLVREPPVGHYFDPQEPTLAATVRSLNGTSLVYPPLTKTKYSNAGIAVAGYVLEHTRQQAFAQYMRDSILLPLGLKRASFEVTPEVKHRLAAATMWTYDGQSFPAPQFQLGTAPAGNLYASMTDLAAFLITLFDDGRTPTGAQLLKPETIALMQTPQRSPTGEPTEFGIGFHISQFEDRRRVGHGGAVYGFATELAALPDEKLGVAAAAAKDGAGGVVQRIANFALRLLLATKHGQPLPELQISGPVPVELSRQLAGRYAGGEIIVELAERNGHLKLRRGAFEHEVRALADRLVVDGVLAFGPEILHKNADMLEIAGQPFQRTSTRRPEPIPERWRGLIGEYGWDHNVLYILERDGQLFALIEWFYYYPLRELSADLFAFPDYGLYHGEKLAFHRNFAGKATSVTAAEVNFLRRQEGPEDGQVFRIHPQRPIAELRAESLAASPPHEAGPFRQPDLVELTRLDPTIQLDVRYATADNFLGEPCYTQPRAFLQRPAAEALVRVHHSLKAQGYGLRVHDAYRPWYVTRMFYEATPAAMRQFVANPSSGSRHNRGSAVDLTLYDLETGRAVAMPSVYDEFSPRAYPDYPGGTALARWHRELLRQAMQAQGFAVYDFEWWHFDHGDWRHYPILNTRFEDLPPAAPGR